MKKKILTGTMIAVSVVALSVAGIANAAYTLFGSGAVVGGGNPGQAIQAVSDTSDNPGNTLNDFGGATFDDANGTFVSSLTTLSTDFNVTDDNCGLGSPRFQIRVDFDNDDALSIGDKRIFVYLGSHPNYNTCTPGVWTFSGNLVTAVNPVWDTSQVGGTFYDTYANASALTSTNEILSISLVVDGGGANGDPEQTVLFDNVTINSSVTDFEPTPTPTPGPFDAPEECTAEYGAPIVGTAGSDNINGTGGNDLIFALGGSDRVDGKGGNDCIVGGDGSDRLMGANGADVILGGDGSDSIDGGNQNDKLYGQGGSDSISGGNHEDELFGGDGSDSLRGGNHNDNLLGGDESDSLRGEGGNDTLDGEGGVDSANGGPGGNDSCTAEAESACEI